MKKFIVLILMLAFLMISFGCTTIAANSPGPATNSGDGVSDGSGLTPVPFGVEVTPGPGPAPSSGDGVSEGSGF